MTKQEALQKFASHVDVPALKADFPDLDYVITELEDGQQEIIVRLQGEDSDFRPSAYVAEIDAVTMADFRIPDDASLEEIAAIEALVLEYFPDGKPKSGIVLRKHKRKLIRLRKRRRDIALLKRIKTLIAPAGVSLRKIEKVIRNNMPVEDSKL